MKAVIPAAGHGIRFLPLTKEEPKEMLPVVDKPTIQYVVEEAIGAGITDILIITGRGKRALEDYFDKSWELEDVLEKKGKTEELKQIRKISNMVDIHFIRQKEARGLGDAIYQAKKHVGDEPFAVMLGDTINISEVPLVKQLMNVHERTGSSVIAVEAVAREKIQDYGIISGKEIEKGIHQIDDLVEKPSPEEAPSNLGITGTYILNSSIFDCIERTPPGRGGEIQLTDAIKVLAQKEKVYGYEFEGLRYDIGDMLGWLKTNFKLALEHPKYSEPLRNFLKEEFNRLLE